MKTLWSLVLAWQSMTLLAQTAGVGSQPSNTERHFSAPAVIERGPHHRVWERVEQVPGPEGKPVERRHRYEELATGLHFQNERGEWEEAQEQIEILPNNAGAAAMKGQHKVIFPPEITAGLIELQTPEGKWLRSRVWGLAYFDAATGESVLLAEVKESEGQLVGDNVVNYPDAFTDLRADVRYTYTRAKFEQDVVLREEPPSPEQLGLNPETTRLQVLTEFVEAPQPTKARKQTGGLTDETLGFGVMSIGAGKAFEATETEKFGKPVPVVKEWGMIEGRAFLIEGAAYKKIVEAIRKLPAGSQYKGAQLERRGKGGNTLAGLKKYLPKQYAKTLPAPASAIKRMAQVTPRTEAGLVMDYVTLNATYTNYVFQGDTTYYISGATLLKGNTVVEGGTVIKFNSTGDGYIELLDDGSTVDCRTAPYRPAVFTSKNDNTVGETISGSTGNPSQIPTAALFSVYTATEFRLRNIRASYLTYSLYLFGADLILEDAQILHADYPITTDGSLTALRNVLLHDVPGAALTIWGSSLDAEHLTVNKCNVLIDSGSYLSGGGITNSLFVSITNWGYSFTSVNNATNASASGVFQTVGGGAHYLTTNSVHRNVGTTNINADLLASLRTKTTYPPLAYTNITFSVPTTLGPQAQRDTDLPDLGYHYDPLDYVLGGCETSSNLTFTAGTAVGWFRTTSGWYHAGQALRMIGNIVVSFAGTATEPTYFVRLNTVQENDRTAGYGHGGIENWEQPAIPIVRGRFLRCTAMANEQFNGYFADDYGWVRAEMTHTEFWSGSLQTYGDYMFYTNCLMWRLGFVGMVSGGADSAFVLRNSTMIGGRLEMQRSTTASVLVRDCAFDGTTISLADYYGSNPTYTDCDYNAYTNTANPFPIGGSHDVGGVSSFNWQSSWLGNYYLPTNSVVINKGSGTAGAAGLYHFTTQTNQTKEAASVVDIGYHYVAVDGNGKPIDTDGDGLPDYLEDANGNGSYDTGDWSNWTSADTDGDGMNDGMEILLGRNPRVAGSVADTGNQTKLQVFTPLK